MSKRTTLTITIALALTVVGVGTAQAAGGATSGETISTIRAIDPDQNLVVLTDGSHLVVTDPGFLADLHEGEIVKVQYTQEGDRYRIDSIEAVDREPSPYDQMHVGEGESTGALPIKRPAGKGDQPLSASPSEDGDGPYRDTRAPEAP